MNKTRMMELQQQRSEEESLLQRLQWAAEVDREAGRAFTLAPVAESASRRLEAIDKEIIEVAMK